MHIRVGSVNGSYEKKINHQYELFGFLLGEESITAYNIGDVDILVLATIINQPIHLLMYHLQGLPPQTPFLEQNANY